MRPVCDEIDRHFGHPPSASTQVENMRYRSCISLADTCTGSRGITKHLRLNARFAIDVEVLIQLDRTRERVSGWQAANSHNTQGC